MEIRRHEFCSELLVSRSLRHKDALCGHHVCLSVCLSVPHPVSTTEPSVAFSSKSVEELFTKGRRVNVSFVKIGSQTVTFYWRAKMNFHRTFHISWSISVKLGTADLHMSRWATVSFMQVCLVKGVLCWRAQTNEILSIFVTFFVRSDRIQRWRCPQQFTERFWVSWQSARGR